MNDLVPRQRELITWEDSITHLGLALSTRPQIKMPVIHHFSPGVYAREISIPAGTFAIGKVHTTEHLNILSKGSLRLWTGPKEYLDLAAPCTFVSAAGAQKVVYIKEDCVLTTIHPTTETDLPTLSKMLTSEPPVKQLGVF